METKKQKKSGSARVRKAEEASAPSEESARVRKAKKTSTRLKSAPSEESGTRRKNYSRLKEKRSSCAPSEESPTTMIPDVIDILSTSPSEIITLGLEKESTDNTNQQLGKVCSEESSITTVPEAIDNVPSASSEESIDKKQHASQESNINR